MAKAGDRRVQRIVQFKHNGQRRRITIVAKAVVGGVYADLSFGGSGPVEVINLWNYETNASILTDKRGLLGSILDEWIKAEDDEEIKYSDDGILNRDWLRNYYENAMY